MVLVVDVGNTRIKGAVFEDAILLEVFIFTKSELKINIESILKKFKNVYVAPLGESIPFLNCVFISFPTHKSLYSGLSINISSSAVTMNSLY